MTKTMKNNLFRWGAICLAAFMVLAATIPVKAQVTPPEQEGYECVATFDFWNADEIGNTSGTAANLSNVQGKTTPSEAVTGVSSVTRAMLDKAGGLGFGSASATGTITLTLDAEYAAKRIVVIGAGWSNSESTFTINGDSHPFTWYKATAAATSDITNASNNPIVKTFENATNTLTFATTSKRGLVYRVFVYQEESAPTVPDPTAEVVGGDIHNFDFDLGDENSLSEIIEFKVHNITSDLTVEVIPSAKSASLEVAATSVTNPTDLTINADTTLEVLVGIESETTLTAGVYQDTIVVKQGDVVMAKAVINIVVNDLSVASIAISGLEDAEGTSLTSFTADSVKVKFALANITEIAATINAKLQGDVEGSISYLESENGGTAELWLKNLASGSYEVSAEIVETANTSNVIASTALPASFTVDLPNTANVTFHRGATTDADAAEIELTDAANVTLESEGAAIYYTIDGSDPKEQGILYENPINVDTLVRVIKAFAIAAHSDTSAVTSVTYTRTDITSVEFTPAATAFFAGTLNVKINATPTDAAIYYTVNGENPTQEEGTLYTADGIDISATSTIRARAFKAGDITPAAPAVAEYEKVSITPASLPHDLGSNTLSYLTAARGYYKEGLETYGSDPKLQFNTTGDFLVFGYNDVADSLSFSIKGNSTTASCVFKIYTSEDGAVFNELWTAPALSSTKTTYNMTLPLAARYIRWSYDNKAEGNVALGQIKVWATDCADPVLNPADAELDQATISWKTGTAITTGYEVKLAQTETGLADVAWEAVAETNKVFESLDQGTKYYYCVRALCTGDRKSDSTLGDFTTLAPGTKSFTITNLELDGSTTFDSTDVKFEFTTSNFDLGTDGKIEITIGENAAVYADAAEYWYTGLVSGDYDVTFRLVDMANAAFDPDVKHERSFEVNLKDVETPVFSKNADDVYDGSVSVGITCATDGASIYYTLDGTEPTIESTPYSSEITLGSTKTIKAIAVKAGMDNSAVASATYKVVVAVANLRDLRDSAKVYGTSADRYYKITGKVIVGGKVASTSGKNLNVFAQDETAGITIFDAAGDKVTALNVGDGITDLVGKIDIYNGLVEIIPNAALTASSTGNTVDTTVVSLAECLANKDNYESRLVRINELTWTSTGTFAANQTYKVKDVEGTELTVRSNIAGIDFVGETIPTGRYDLIGLLGNNYGTLQISPRSLSDMISNPVTEPTIMVQPTLSITTAESVSKTAEVEITGALLTADVTLALGGANASAFTLSEDTFAFADVNATAGVTLKVTYNGSLASAAATVTLKSVGAADKVINVTGTASAATAVANLRDFRDSVAANGASLSRYYKVAGEVVVTARNVVSGHVQIWAQDATAGILIYDEDADKTVGINVGDGITGMVGGSALYNELLEFIPSSVITASTTDNTVEPIVVTASALADDVVEYESRVVRINELTWISTGTFASGKNYTLEDAAEAVVDIRTALSEADYIGEAIPSGRYDIIGLVRNFNGAAELTPRSLSDMISNPGVGVEDAAGTAASADLVVYPNPASASGFNVKVAVPSVVTIFNATGAKVGVVSVGSEAVVKSLSSGLYLLRAVSAEGKVSTARVIIK